ncbi:MAG: DUF1080 domain-containing protein [Gemmataceae bacterium]
MRSLVLLLALAVPAAAADGGWTDLLTDAAWKKVDKNWVKASAVRLKPGTENRLEATPAADGPVWVNGPLGRLPDLYTKAEFGDCEVHVEFLIARRSNSGIKFHGVYEVQILDSAGKPADKLSGDDCGGVYPRAEYQQKKYVHLDKGIAPRVNAAKPAGEWQTLDVTFRAPRFDADGKKVENAKIVKATLNGQVIHENQELKYPTGANWTVKEKPTGPFMIQADHGPVAVRNVRIRALAR